jgi:hypothetical protein
LKVVIGLKDKYQQITWSLLVVAVVVHKWLVVEVLVVIVRQGMDQVHFKVVHYN